MTHITRTDPEAPAPAQAPEQVPPARRSLVALWMLGGVLVLALGAALREMAPVVIPIVFAVLITLVVLPLHSWLCEKLPDRVAWLSHVGVMALILGVIAAFFGALVVAAERVLQIVPDMSGDVGSLLPSDGGEDSALPQAIQEFWGRISDTIGGWLVGTVTGLARTIAQATGIFVSTLIVVLFLVLLALSERGIWRRKIQSLWPGDGQVLWSNALETIAIRLRRFLVMRTAIGLLQAALYVGWLALFGVDLLFVWGLLSFILTYIPNFGAIVAGILPVIYALATKDFGTALGVAGGLLVIEQVVGNFIDPKLLGRQIVLSPFVILVSLLFWSALWGIAGAFLATPIMLVLLVAFNQVRPLRPIALAFSDQPTPQDLDDALAQT